jgi:hypothetical protein
MDARPWLERIAHLLTKHHLEAILIGNAAAALQGAPVTTVDFDFLFRKTPANLKKLKAVAQELEAVILKPYYPASGLHRISRDVDNLQLDFMTTVDGISSLESLRKRSHTISLGDSELQIADLSDILASQHAAACPPADSQQEEAPTAPENESELALRDQIRRLLALPIEKRTNFLRKRIGFRMSAF